MAEACLRSEHKETYQTSLLNRYTECAEHLIKKCKELSEIPGAAKLERKCAAELKYLRSLARRRGGYDVTHLRSSNLSHYAGVLHSADNLPNVTHILQAFSCPGRTEALHMDVVAGRGHIWLKVIARKAQALHLIWGGQGQYGEKDIVMQAKDFVVCSKVHPVNFQDPKVVFAFYNGVTGPIAERLQKCGVIVIGEIVAVDSDVDMKLLQLSVEDTDSEEDNCSSSDDEVRSEENDPIVNTGGICTCFNDNQHAPFDAGRNLSGHCLICGKQYSCGQIPDVSESVPASCDNNISESNLTLDTEQPQNMGSLESDSAVAEKISDLGSCRQSQYPSSDISTVTVTNEIYPILSETCSTTLISTDSQRQITRLPFVTIDEQLKKTTQLTCDTAQYCPKKQFLPKNDSANNSMRNEDFNLDKWNNTSVLHFIRSELLLNHVLDFHVIRRILADNEINSIDKIRKINLDITALITLVSAVSHGGCYYRFREKILSEQAAEERVDPVLPKLQAFLEGKDLYTCQTAADSFNSILDTLGGQKEKERAAELLSRLTIVPDKPSFRASMIPKTGKIKDRSKVIFGTGDSLRAVTVTANSGFVRAAEHQGVTFAVFLHASRALTEQKEKTAEKLVVDS
ncbi:UPF0415 protein C7orf25 homolog [Mercenaria mercenaria]|uniref:UPF0415 protein C7orf25 homolog n=1 Tax=Mercenaria mercenaria TaxID=6596 RepID=UPI00234E6FA5|nr:UPF0415 protein C7orf25 homolog [Mercenaria mercenaria]XP_053373187.1 UPF0415 protein C7orf25 homolog [Mercenaria mercenaria]